MIRIAVYIILFMLGYRVLKRFFAPNFGEVKQGEEPVNPFMGQPTLDKSDVIEDVDYEEVE